MKLRWPLFWVYDEEGNKGLSIRRPLYRPVQYSNAGLRIMDFSEFFDRLLDANDYSVLTWLDVTPRDIKREWIHEWIEEKESDPSQDH